MKDDAEKFGEDLTKKMQEIVHGLAGNEMTYYGVLANAVVYLSILMRCYNFDAEQLAAIVKVASQCHVNAQQFPPGRMN